MDKYQNKYRIPSARAQFWDYGWDAAYFVTICTQNRQCLFGEVMDGKMKLSGAGIIADILWYEIKNHAKNIELGEFVVMPNHLHGILIMNGNAENTPDDTDNVETRHALSLPPASPAQPAQPAQSLPISTNQTIGQNRFQNQGKNTLSSIIGAYKSAVTKHAHRLGIDFAWQPRFHDHIIRDDKSYQNISNYIINNPLKWKEDKFHVQ